MLSLLILLMMASTSKSGNSYLTRYAKGISEASNYPYHAFVAQDYYTIVCGAGILTTMHAISAANCVTNDTVLYQILVRSSKHFDGTMYSVKEIIIHPNFNPLNLKQNNFAILRVKPVWKYNKKLQKIEVASGFMGGPYTAFTPKPSQVRLQSTRICERLLGSKIHDGDICAYCAEGGCDLCSSGPGELLVSDGKLVGMFSYCSEDYSPAIYVNMSKYVDFINKAINNKIKYFPSKLIH